MEYLKVFTHSLPADKRTPPVQRKKAIELQQAWGDKPCDHPTFAREYDLGERTGNYCCQQCGTVVTFREKVELKQKLLSGADADRAKS